MSIIRDTVEWAAAKNTLSSQFACRSGDSYFVHIEEGIRILEKRHASLVTMQAFCLHPLFQGDEDLVKNIRVVSLVQFSPAAVLLVMEYRQVANSGGQDRWRQGRRLPTSILPEVNEMLIADKVQNLFSVERVLRRTGNDVQAGYHIRELRDYFQSWFKVLEVSEDEYKRLTEEL